MPGVLYSLMVSCVSPLVTEAAPPPSLKENGAVAADRAEGGAGLPISTLSPPPGSGVAWATEAEDA